MKKNNKPLSSAETAKQLGISQEQFEAQRKTHETHKDKNPDWPPFPLPDIYYHDAPGHIYAAIYAMGRIRRNYIPDVGFNGGQYKYAVEVAFDIRSVWSNEGLVLPNIPLSKNIKWPTEQDFFELEKWFLNASILVEAEIARYNAARTQQANGTPPQENPTGQNGNKADLETARTAKKKPWYKKVLVWVFLTVMAAVIGTLIERWFFPQETQNSSSAEKQLPLTSQQSETAKIFAYVSPDGKILQSNNFRWKITKTKNRKGNIVYVINGRQGDITAISVLPDNSMSEYKVSNGHDGMVITFTCAEEKISNFRIEVKY